MEFEPEEQQIVELLTKLKSQQGGAYPKKLLASRRQVFLGQVASVGAGLGIGAGLKTVAKASKTGSVFHLSSFSVSSLVETLLVVAIIAQAGFIAYTYRDRIVDFVNSLSVMATPTVTSIPVTGSSVPEVVASETPIVTETLTEVLTKTATVGSSDVISSDTTSNGNNSIQNTAVAETPQPTKDNPGNHFGQTPKPTQEQNNTNSTSDNGGSGGSGNGNGNGNGNGKKP